jgi:hypothetical protein
MKSGKVMSPHLIAVGLILLVSALSTVSYFTEGKSIYHVSSIASSTLLYLKLQLDNFKNLYFYPQYWTNLFYTGGPIHTGLGVYNPLLLLLVFFRDFGDAIIAYEILLKVIGGMGIYCLSKKYEFSTASSVCCALIYTLNPYCAAFGSDPQLASILYYLPWLILLIELIVDSCGNNILTTIYGVILALVLSLCYLSSNIQSYTFLVSFVILPFVFLRLYWMYTEVGNKKVTSRESKFKPILNLSLFITAAFVLNAFLILFELVPTYNVIKHGDRIVEFDPKIIIYFVVLLVATMGFASRHWKLTTCLGISALVLTFVCDPKTGSLFNPLQVNYLQKISEAEFVFDIQPLRYYLSALQLLIFIFVIIKNKQKNRRMTLFYLSLAFFLLNMLFILHHGVQSHSILFPFAKLRNYLLPDFYYRSTFIPFIGLSIALAYGLDNIGKSFGKRGATVLFFGVALLVSVETYYLYMNRTLFTAGFDYVKKESPEYRFLRKVSQTERVISAYNRVHKRWNKSFKPEIMPKWLIPPYFGANTFSRVGIAIIPKWNAMFNRSAMPHYYGIDETNPVTNLLSLAGVKYIFSYNEIVGVENLKLLEKGREYFIYENMEVLPRIILFGKVANASKTEVILPNIKKDSGPVVFSGDDAVLLEMHWMKSIELLDKVFISGEGEISLNNDGVNDISLMNGTSFFSSLGEASITGYKDEYVEIDCNISQDSFLMLTDTYFPGWNVYVDGNQREIYRSDLIFMGVRLYPGDKKVKFIYEPKIYKYSLIVSFVTFIFVMVTLCFLVMRFLLMNRHKHTISSY